MINQDAYTEQAHRVAMDRARDTGSPQATRMVYVLTESNELERRPPLSPGFAVYLPVYAEGEPVERVAARRRVLQGFVVGYFRQDGLLDDVFGSGFDPAIDFELYDGADVASSSLLYDEDGVERAGEEGSILSSPRRTASGWPGESGACTSPRCRDSRRVPRATCRPSCWPAA